MFGDRLGANRLSRPTPPEAARTLAILNTDHDMNDADAALSQVLEIADYRRHVAALYTEVRERGVSADTWEWWRNTRTELLLQHPQSPAANSGVPRGDVMNYFDYDPSWNVVGRVEPLAADADAGRVGDAQSVFEQVGTVSFERDDVVHQLGLFWLDAYGGGLFLPFRDLTNGTDTYGGGRYLLDAAKSADLGSVGPNELVLDFNFSYHPSCSWDSRWTCPLAPPSNHLSVAVTAGERAPSVPHDH